MIGNFNTENSSFTQVYKVMQDETMHGELQRALAKKHKKQRKPRAKRIWKGRRSLTHNAYFDTDWQILQAANARDKYVHAVSAR